MSPVGASHPRWPVLVVARHFAVRRGLQHLLATCADCQLIGEAHDEATALTTAARQQPDVIVLDWPLNDSCDGKVVSQLRQCVPSARILLLVTFGDAPWPDPGVHALADGVLPKSRAGECLVEAIRALRRREPRTGEGVG